ncbi:helix-turn-helix domain-containing protein [Parvibaculum sp.]|uniref:helix-turn-helix domain-containing protein n=1 Tax=Parvibaculum sp. TaxID=2024848 RepID=UPI00391B1EC0
MWAGRFEFGEGWAVYRGRTDANAPHRHAAIQIAAGRDAGIAMRSDRTVLEARAIVIPPMVRHEFLSARGEVTALYVEAELPLGRALRRRFGEAISPLPESLAASLSTADPENAIIELSAFLDIAAPEALDPRLTASLAFLRNEPGERGAIGAAAKAAGLSAQRLRELAQAELGVALSQSLLWQKLGRASRAIAAGATLAEAAASGGFSDQAHFSRTMRRMFGVTPGVAAGTLG